MKVRTFVTVIILALVAAQDAGAQVFITSEICRDRALRYSDDLRIEEARHRKAGLLKKEQSTHYLPKVSASAYYINNRTRFEWDVDRALFGPLGAIIDPAAVNPLTGRPINDVSGHHIMKQSVCTTGVRVEQPLYMGGKIRAANRMAAIGEEIGRKSVEARRQEILVEADMAYWRYVAVSEQVEAALKYVELLDALVTRVRNAVETGLIHRNELLKVQVRRNEAALQLEKGQNGRELLRMSLCRIMGYDIQTPLEIADLSIIVESLDTIGISRVSVENRMDFRMLEDNIDLKKMNEKLVRADFLPRLGLAAGYQHTDGLEIYHTSLSERGYYVMASAKVPLWQWGEAQYRTQSAKLDSHIAEVSLQKYEKLMELEIRQAFFAMSEAHSRCGMTAASLQQAESSMELSRDFYETGLEQLTDYLEAQAQWQRAQGEHISAKADFKIQKTAYLKAIGTLAAVPERPEATD